MRQLFLLICFVGLPLLATGQKDIDRFISKHLHHPKAVTLSLPQWFARLVGNLAIDEEEELQNDYKALIRGVKHVRIFRIARNHVTPDIESDLDGTLATMQDQDDFDLYLSHKESKNHVKLFLKEQNDKVKSAVFIINEDENLVLLRLKLDIDLEQILALDYAKT